MSGLDDFDLVVPRPDQLWYIGHPVHPTDEDMDELREREREVWATYPDKNRKLVSDREAREMIIRGNIAGAKAWLAWLKRRFPSVTFIAPWIAALDGGGDDDLDPKQRARGLRDCCRTIRVCSGMVQTGGRLSAGMIEESKSARNIIDLTYLGRVPPVDDRKVVP